MNEKVVDNSASGRIDVYMNGLGGRPDGYLHDHIWATGSPKPGGVFSGGIEDRSAQRDALVRGLGGTALGGS